MPALSISLGFNPYALRIAHAALEAREHYAANWETMRVQARLLKSSLDLSAGAGKAAGSNPPFTLCETHASFLLARLAQPLAPAALEALALQSGALPKAFSHGAVRYLRWGLGPDLVRERIVRFMGLLAQRQDSDAQGHLAAKASSTSDSSNSVGGGQGRYTGEGNTLPFTVRHPDHDDPAKSRS